jgi:hypothetical protein
MLTKEKILNLLKTLNANLKKQDIKGEIYLTGGAVMCLVFDARPSTIDIDAIFKPAEIIRREAANIALAENLNVNWLNDAVKGFLSDKNSFNNFLELSNLIIYTPHPEYLLAMKCLAMRIGFEFHDEQDVRYLLRFLNIEKYEEAVKIITKYYPLERFPQKTLYALEELLIP